MPHKDPAARRRNGVAWYARTLPLSQTLPMADYLRSCVIVDVGTGCWAWQRGHHSQGYGVITVAKENRYAHRVSYETFVGSIPAGLELDHLCRNPPCINPAHLEAVAWHFDRYAARQEVVDGKLKRVYMHREIMNAQPGDEIDHINGDRLDNRKSNLRFCTRLQNLANQRARSGGSSSYKGVHWDKEKRKWAARISFHDRRTRLGYFSSQEDAARAYDAAAKRLFGEFARPNMVDADTGGGK